MTAYAFGIELGRLLAGRTVQSVSSSAGALTIAFSGGGRRFLHLLTIGRETEIVLAQDRLLPVELSRPAFGDLTGAEVTSVSPLGLERVILARFASKSAWDGNIVLTLRIDLSPVSRAAALFREGTARAVETFGAPGSRIPGSPDQLPPARRWSLLDLPAGWKMPAEEEKGDGADRGGGSAREGGTDGEGGSNRGGVKGREGWAKREGGSAGGTNGARSAVTPEFLAANIGGVDPVLAAALTELCGDDTCGLSTALSGIGARLAAGDFRWGIYDLPGAGERGICSVYPVPLPFDPRPGTGETMLEALDARTREKVLPAFTSRLRNLAMKSQRRALRKTRRLLANIEEDLRSALRAEEMRRMGNLLVTWRHRMRTGMKEITVVDFNGEDEISIPLDPALDPEGNIRSYFRRAKKGEKGLEIIKARRASVRKDVEELERTIAKTSAIDDPAVLSSLIDPGSGETGGGKKSERSRPRFRSYPVDEKHTILVGRSDRENDELTHRYAAPTDLWFHAQGVPGSHVVLRGANRSTPARIIELAASAAAWFSKARGSGTVAVICAEKRHVRRPRGSKPGTASCTRSKTLFVAPAPPDADTGNRRPR